MTGVVLGHHNHARLAQTRLACKTLARKKVPSDRVHDIFATICPSSSMLPDLSSGLKGPPHPIPRVILEEVASGRESIRGSHPTCYVLNIIVTDAKPPDTVEE